MTANVLPAARILDPVRDPVRVQDPGKNLKTLSNDEGNAVLDLTREKDAAIRVQNHDLVRVPIRDLVLAAGTVVPNRIRTEVNANAKAIPDRLLPKTKNIVPEIVPRVQDVKAKITAEVVMKVKVEEIVPVPNDIQNELDLN